MAELKNLLKLEGADPELLLKYFNEGKAIEEIKALLKSYSPSDIPKIIQNGQIHIDDLRKLIPQGVNDTFVPSSRIEQGSKFQYEINGQKIEVKWHSPDSGAPPRSNSASGWTAQIKIGNKLLGLDGNLYRRPNNLTHIPIQF